jgi:SET domain-containing protein
VFLNGSISVEEGSFVVEYVGEVIDEEERDSRVKRYQESGNPHFFLMEISKEIILDAGPAGGVARFINHSCNPNLETQKVRVGSETRVGLFALRDIAVGEELTYDYQFAYFGSEPWKCLCRSSNCRGVLAGEFASLQLLWRGC